MKVGLVLESAARVREATSVGIVPAWLVQLSAVPGNVRQTALTPGIRPFRRFAETSIDR